MGCPNRHDKANATVSLKFEDGGRLNITLSRTARGPVVHAEERGVDGRVVGTMAMSQQVLMRTLGVVQRALQAENAGRDTPCARASGHVEPDSGGTP